MYSVSSFVRAVSGAASWRIPLAIQIFPGLLLAVGAFVLPPSPRLMIIQGDYDGALQVLARLRRRRVEDELLQVSCTFLFRYEANTIGVDRVS